MRILPKKYQETLDIFIQKYKKDKNVVGIFLTGSFVHSTPDKNSDLDVYILLKESNTRERGNTWINGIEIEYFINPIKQVEEYFKTEKEKHSAHMFSNLIILYEKGNYLKKLINKAKKIISKKENKMTSFEIENAKYYLDDLKKDLEDAYLKKDFFVFKSVFIELISKINQTFLKVKRVRPEKPKRLLKYLEELDPRFASLYSSVLLENDYNLIYKKVLELIIYIENLLGGSRTKEWKLKGPCTYIK